MIAVDEHRLHAPHVVVHRAARALTGYASRPPEGLDIRYRSVNGGPAAVIFTGDSPYAVMVVDLIPQDGQVSGVYLVTNPDKLSGVRDEAGQRDADPEPGEGAHRHRGS
ncbi:hypothetical protein GCM10010377_43130 [Streptomyces viridiviolaceus]|uniref:Uncharacterized protein n=1 Tax=Streptomyces viridiviolaceus TaxID=68282 RepID=A0ABW2EEU5_9ACTN|nr:hypothetical protein [Streptomyces viridiviolaceus]GHB47708.1 hypothetical protein GCM10010377_43130 [Streptomyces viridiviolaceus]